MMRLQMLIGKVTTVLLLIIGAISPLFRPDIDAKIAAAVSIFLLGSYSLIQVVRTHSWQPSNSNPRRRP